MNANHLFFFRAVLYETLLLQTLEASGADTLRVPWIILSLYAVFGGAMFWLGRRRKVSDRVSLASFIADIAATTAILMTTHGMGGDYYIAYFIVILASCMLQNLLYSFVVGGVTCVVYGAMIFPGLDWLDGSTYLLRLSLLMATSLFSTFIVDSTRRIRQESQDLYESRLAWMERLSTVGEAVAGVLHELKTPANTILLGAEYVKAVLDRPEERARAEAQLDIIRDEAERVGQVLADFLNFARPTELELTPTPIGRPLRKACERLAVRAEDRGVLMESSVAEDTVVSGSETHLLQVFLNLLGNAIDAMPLGGRVSVSERRHGGSVDILIVDNGVGIEPERLRRLFEPFQTSKAGTGGHGIGLSVVQWIIHKHRGDIRIHSHGPGRGTEVVVTFPLSAPAR